MQAEARAAALQNSERKRDFPGLTRPRRDFKAGNNQAKSMRERARAYPFFEGYKWNAINAEVNVCRGDRFFFFSPLRRGNSGIFRVGAKVGENFHYCFSLSMSSRV